MIINENISGKAGMYLRLSREDGDKLESDSIRSQRAIITDFIGKNEKLKFVKEYVDDGYSGTNFERPAFQRMYEDARKGVINCLIVKDLSRLGRNYIETGRYLEKLFPLLGLRVIAINDNYDSADKASDENQIIVPFKNLINDAYCRDISLKIRSNFDVKMKNGQYIGSFAGFGYEKDREDKNHLVIDKYAAEVVKKIFNMKMRGYSPAAIAKKLDEMGIQTPYEYKRKCGLKYNSGFRSTSAPKWAKDTITRILQNELYIGTMVQGKTRKINYKVHKCLRIDRANWVKVEGTHDAIIRQEEFELVQAIMSKDTRTAPDHEVVYPLSGYVKCAGCGQNMIRRTSTKKGKKYYYYHCTTYKNGGECTSHMINTAKVEDAVLSALQMQIALLDKAELILSEIDNYPNELLYIQAYDKQLQKLQDELEYYGTLKATLYKDMVEGLISKNEYIDLGERFENNRADTEQAYYKLKEQRELAASGQMNFQPWIEEFKQYRNIKSISRAMVVSLLDKVVINDSDEIEVVFLFKDEMAELIKVVTSEENERNEMC